MIGNTLDFVSNPTSQIVQSAMAFRRARNEMINSNIANVDTPFYKSRDIRFEGYLTEQTKIMFDNKQNSKLQLARSNSSHIQPKQVAPSTDSYVFFRDGHMTRNDGNSVDLDTETTEMAKNTSAYKALSALLKKQSSMFKYAIESSSKLA